MANPTPGPWFVVERVPAGPAGFHEGAGCFQIVDNEDPARATTLCTRFPWVEKADEMRANARLIAAAPELLEALQALLTRVTKGYDGLPQGHGVSIARAAIAKAQGAAS